MSKRIVSVFYAVLAAVLYAINIPISKQLLNNVNSTLMASFLYLGAGIGVGILYCFHFKQENPNERLTKRDLPYTISMIVLDILAPIFLMLGIQLGSSANASLLGNFEIVATTIIALIVFKESVSGKLWTAIFFITLSSILLSFESVESFQFSIGSLFVLLATLCWGFENNCTRKISDKSTYEIVMLKGIFSGSGSFIVAMILSEQLPKVQYILWAMLLGFVAYGLSIFLYIRAQRDLGAAKTSAYYAIAPFVGFVLSVLINNEQLHLIHYVAFIVMMVGSIFVVIDTMMKQHSHQHVHSITHTHSGSTHTHQITHEHSHNHLVDEQKHSHLHKDYMNSLEHRLAHENKI